MGAISSAALAKMVPYGTVQIISSALGASSCPVNAAPRIRFLAHH